MPRPNERWTSTNASESVAPLDDSLIQDMIFGAQWSHPVFGDSTQPRASDAEPLNLLAIEYDVDIEELQRFSSARILRLKSSSLCSEEMSQLSMPRLEEIVLHHSPINEVSELLGSLRAPNLTHLQIIQGYGDPSAENALENTLELSLNVRFPLLQSLSIINTEHGSWPLIQHLTDLHDQSIPSRITHLDLTTYHWDDCEPAFRPLLHNLVSCNQLNLVAPTHVNTCSYLRVLHYVLSRSEYTHGGFLKRFLFLSSSPAVLFPIITCAPYGL
ncbi:hypothetical protein DL93DRAFT_2076525, partial [Clavulina sp. PMI_390]